MQKILSTLAIAGLAAGLAVGAQAQTTGTVTGNPASQYTLNVQASVKDGSGNVVASPTVSPTAGSGPLYTYSYLINVANDSSNSAINTITIGSIQGFAGGTSETGAFNNDTATTSLNGLTSVTYNADGSNGDFTSGSTTLSYRSRLAPFGVVGITPAANTTGGGNGGAGIGRGFIGPGTQTPTIPETSSFALLGLGLLPLGFLARRRLANRA